MTDAVIPASSPDFQQALLARFDADVAKSVALSAALCAIPGITVPAPKADMDAVLHTFEKTRAAAVQLGLRVLARDADAQHPYPFLIIGFQDHDLADPNFSEAVGFIGHIDVVPPRQADQFVPVLRGGDLYARGAADMKTVVASWLVWMERQQRRSGPKPPVLLLISCCEENGSDAPHHSESVMDWLLETHGVTIRFGLVGERTGELEWMENPVVGPICKENRSWRWIRISQPTATASLDVLHTLAATMKTLRQEITHLNAQCIPQEKSARQPGVRSGVVNAFTLLSTEPNAQTATWLQVRRPPGKAVHAAAANAANASLIERFSTVAKQAEERFPTVRLGGVRIGQDRNFNSTDGSGKLWLSIDAPDAELMAWATSLHADDMVFSIVPALPQTQPTRFGLDIRELLDHQQRVLEMLSALPNTLPGWDVERINDRPAWRCPKEHPDLMALEAAYATVVGSPSPDLVKLHGNDGGSLAAIVHRDHPQQARLGAAPAVVFGQVGKHPHGRDEFHRCESIQPYWDILDHWAASLTAPSSQA